MSVGGPHDDGHPNTGKYRTDYDLQDHQCPTEADVPQIEGVTLGVALRKGLVHDQHPAVPEAAPGGFVTAYQVAGVFGKVLRNGGGHVDGLKVGENE